jgi:hypothetical protein
VFGTLAAGSEPGQDLAPVFHDRPLPLGRSGGRRVAPTSSPRWPAAAASVGVRERRALSRVRDVHAGGSGPAPVRHKRPSDDPRNLAPGGTHRGTQMSGTEGFAGVRRGRTAQRKRARNPCTTQETSQQRGCRRRDSNPRHADYDSAALWLYRAKNRAGGHKSGHDRTTALISGRAKPRVEPPLSDRTSRRGPTASHMVTTTDRGDSGSGQTVWVVGGSQPASGRGAVPSPPDAQPSTTTISSSMRASRMPIPVSPARSRSSGRTYSPRATALSTSRCRLKP